MRVVLREVVEEERRVASRVAGLVIQLDVLGCRRARRDALHEGGVPVDQLAVGAVEGAGQEGVARVGEAEVRAVGLVGWNLANGVPSGEGVIQVLAGRNAVLIGPAQESATWTNGIAAFRG